MLKEAVEHYMNPIYIHALDEKTLLIRLRAKKGDLKECVLYFGDRFCPVNPVIMDKAPMTVVASDLRFDYFEVELAVPYKRICYAFRLSDGTESCFYYGNEFYDTLPADRNELFQFHYLRREEIYTPPAWAGEAVLYQIFPDSFASGRESITRGGTVFHNHLGGESHCRVGGTLQGIIDNLSYLTDLGINCLYLTPVFTADSYHKYDTADYFTVDPCFGSNETLKELVRKCHEQGIRVILDGVFNHCGPQFFAFRDVLKNGEQSKYKDWFYGLEFPVRFADPPNYECFAYTKKMPKMNTGHPEVREYFINVGTYWIKEAGIDGWRLDVADEVDHYFWKCFRRAVKAVKPDALLIGEIWGDAQTWLLGDEFDSTMNYRFSRLCRKFFAESEIGVNEFDARFNYLLMRYPKPFTYLQMNLLDSHDVPRFLAACGGETRRLKLAALFQMMAPGIPSVFYGDEKGLSGATEAEYRQPMNWERTGTAGELHAYYKKLITLRRRFSHLMSGRYRSFLKDETGKVYGFIREKGAERIYILINNSAFWQEAEITGLTGREKMSDLLNDREYRIDGSQIRIELAPFGGAVLIEQ